MRRMCCSDGDFEVYDEMIMQTPPALADHVRGIVEQAMIDGMQTTFGADSIAVEAMVARSGEEK